MIPVIFLLAIVLGGLAGLTVHWAFRQRLYGYIAAAVAFAIVVTFGLRFHSPEPTARSQAAEIRWPLEKPENGYIGSQACLSCHPREHATWYASYHRTMTQQASPAAVVSPFDGTHLRLEHFEFELQQRGDQFWVRMDDPRWDGQSLRPPKVDGRIVMTTGSHHQQYYWLATGQGRLVHQFPFVWLIKEQRWVPDTALFLTPPDSPLGSGAWNTTCIDCHTTNGNPGFIGPGQVESQVAEFGIACEACHGPGEQHVLAQENIAALGRSTAADNDRDRIVNPARLSAQRSAQVCGQCHGISYSSLEEKKRHLKNGSSFRPGDDLHQARNMQLAPEDATSFWPDGTVRVSGREYSGLLKTPCHLRGEMSCISCHRLHPDEDDPRPLKQWANDQLKRTDGDSACTQCHQQYADPSRQASHTHHAADSSGSRCYNCHMPHTTYGLVKAIRSHTIDSPDVAVNFQTGRPNACNLCHLDRTMQWTAEHLDQWYDIPIPDLSDDQQQTAAGPLWSLQGDAGLRALTVWSMGWQPAQSAAGTDWMAPYVGQLLLDPYDAVRLMAGRSLHTLPGFQDVDYDFLADSKERSVVRRRVWELWRTESQAAAGQNAATLINADGRLNEDIFQRLLRGRDDRPVNLAE